VYGEDPGVGCLAYGAATLWHLGYPEQALRSFHAARSLAEELGNPFNVAQALLLAGGMILRDWSLATQGQAREGIGQMRQGLADWQATGALSHRPFHLALMAEALGKEGELREGLTALAEAQALCMTTGERFVEAELHRLRGEMLLAGAEASPAAWAAADECFRQALDVARSQQAKSLELRAAMSLGRLYRQQGRPAEGRLLLTATFGQFTEGFDLPDLLEAKALLERLC
jgi:predicted ATPase